MTNLTRLVAAGAFAVAFLCGSVHAVSLEYSAKLFGFSEDPPNASPGTGSASVVYDTVLHTLLVKADFTGLIGTVTVAHIHGPTASPSAGNAGVITPVPTFPGFPSGVTSGSYNQLFDLTLASSWNPSFLSNNGVDAAGAEQLFAAALKEERTYLNIHSTAFGGGEIRGFLQAVPDASSTAYLLLVALAALLPLRRLGSSHRE